jgi:signal peptidase I
MSPTFGSGQIVLGKLHPRQIRRGSVVVFRRGGETMVKRVAFLPEDRIDQFFFAGEWKMASNELSHDALVRRKTPHRDFVIPEGRVFVLGDNFYESVDSRVYGTVSMKDIVAVVNDASEGESWFSGVHETSDLIARL